MEAHKRGICRAMADTRPHFAFFELVDAALINQLISWLNTNRNISYLLSTYFARLHAGHLHEIVIPRSGLARVRIQSRDNFTPRMHVLTVMDSVNVND